MKANVDEAALIAGLREQGLNEDQIQAILGSSITPVVSTSVDPAPVLRALVLECQNMDVGLSVLHFVDSWPYPGKVPRFATATNNGSTQVKPKLVDGDVNELILLEYVAAEMIFVMNRAQTSGGRGWETKFQKADDTLSAVEALIKKALKAAKAAKADQSDDQPDQPDQDDQPTDDQPTDDQPDQA